MSNREKTTAYLVKQVNAIIPGYKKAGELLEAELNNLTDEQFDQWMTNPKAVIPFYLPNLQKDKVSIARCFKLVRELGRSLTHRLVMTDAHTGVQYLTPHAYPCMDTVVRRQAQTGLKKRSIPGIRQSIDDLSGQPTALSKGGRISAPEAKFLDSRGLIETQNELVHVRGGATAAYREFKKQLLNHGDVNLTTLQGLGPAKSTQVLSAYLNAQGFGNNILPGTAVPADALPRKTR